MTERFRSFLWTALLPLQTQGAVLDTHTAERRVRSEKIEDDGAVGEIERRNLRSICSDKGMHKEL